MSEPRHYLVLGGTRGTGQALVKHLASDPANRVSVFGRHHDDAQGEPNVLRFAVDATDPQVLCSSLDQAVAANGKVSAAVFMQRHRADGDQFETDLAVALGATRTTLDRLARQSLFCEGGASVVMVSSIADHYVAPEQDLGYHVSKAGLVQLARYYALKLGPSGIRVNSISPCVVIKDAAREYYAGQKWLTDRYARLIPLGRAGSSQDIINAIMFLASDQAGYITGQNIVVDGGLTLRSHESIIRDFPHEA